MLRLRGDNSTRLLLASDNEAARAEARARFGAGRVLTIGEAPSHNANQMRAAREEINAALESTVMDWHLLTRCAGGVVLAPNTGFSRTAAAAAQAPLFVWRTDAEIEAADDEAPCGVFATGRARALNRGTGCGW